MVAGLDVGVWAGLVVGAVLVEIAVGAVVGDVDVVGVALAVGDDVAVGVGDDVEVLAVAEDCVAGLETGDWDVGVVVGRCVGFVECVFVGVAGCFVAFPAREAVGVPPFGAPPDECDVSRTATTAMTATAATAAAMGQRHRRNGDGGPAGGGPPVPPGIFRPTAVTAPDTGTRAVAGRRPCSALVTAGVAGAAGPAPDHAETAVSEAPWAGTTGARTVGS